MTRYKVNTGIDYPPKQRKEPGDIADDIPEQSVPWLLEHGIIERVTEKVTPKSTKQKGEGGE